MAYLISTELNEVRSKWAKALSNRLDPCGLTKAELRAAVVAIDVYVEDNAAAINNTLPLPARTVLTKAQKAEIMVLVLEKRYEVDA
ncbi:hypothetical protein KAR91_17145 [Candidatus Pacearchaeota archaeon]|nr:hypothetical protein [Candidatus Pacearchaeota archaeon]